jgi:hypothetical protein
MGSTYQAIDDPGPYYLNGLLDVIYKQDLGRTIIPVQSSTIGSSRRPTYTTPNIIVPNSQFSTPTSELKSTMLESPAIGVEVDHHFGSRDEGHSISNPRTMSIPDVETHESLLGTSGLQWEPKSSNIYSYGFNNVPGILSSPSSSEGTLGSLIGHGLDSPNSFLFSPRPKALDNSQVPLNHQYTLHDVMLNPHFAHSSAVSQLHGLNSISTLDTLQGNSTMSTLCLTNGIGGM